MIHLVTAEHFNVPGLIQKAFATPERANAEAAELVAIMLKDSPMRHKGVPTPATWERHLAALQDYHGAAHCYVEVSALTVEGEPPAADVMASKAAPALAAALRGLAGCFQFTDAGHVKMTEGSTEIRQRHDVAVSALRAAGLEV